MARQFSILVMVSLMVILVPAACHAVFLVQPLSAVASSEFDTSPPITQRIDDYMVDQSGLSASYTTGDPVPGTYPNHGTAVTNTIYLSAISVTNPSIVFDLGQEYVVEGFHIWNYNEVSATERGVQDVTVDFSTTSAVAGFGSTEAITGIAEAPGASYAGDTDKLFSSPPTARWVRFAVTDNWGGSYAGISEVVFLASEVPPVPEPSSLMLLGLGALGLVHHARRRRGK